MAAFKIFQTLAITLHQQHADALRYALEAQEYCTLEIINEQTINDSEYVFEVALCEDCYPNGVNPTQWGNFTNWLQRFLKDL